MPENFADNFVFISSEVSVTVNMNLAINNLFNYVPDYYYFNSPTTTGANLTLGLSLDIDRFFKK